MQSEQTGRDKNMVNPAPVALKAVCALHRTTFLRHKIHERNLPQYLLENGIGRRSIEIAHDHEFAV